MKERPGAGIIIYTVENAEPKYIFLQTAKNPRFWDFPKGGAEGDETPIQCAKREVREELGFREEDYSLHEDWKIEWNYVNNIGVKRDITLFLAYSAKEPELSEEHIDYQFLDFEDSLKQIPHDEQERALRKAHQYLMRKLR